MYRSRESETANYRNPHISDMEIEKWIAIFFVVLMVGSSIAIGAGTLL